jgi:hypothetical protein
MVRYRRNHIAGGKFFFTLTPADRRSTALVDQSAYFVPRFAQPGKSGHLRS